MYFFLGINLAGLAVSSVVAIGVSPLIATVLSFFIWRDKPQKAWYIATFFALCGFISLNYTEMNTDAYLKALVPLLAGASYALYYVFSRSLVKENSPLFVTTCIFLISSLFLLPVLFLFPIAWFFSWQGFLVCLALGFITSGLPFVMLIKGIQALPASYASTLGLAEPVLAATWGIVILGEIIVFNKILGILGIFLSLIILIVKGK